MNARDTCKRCGREDECEIPFYSTISPYTGLCPACMGIEQHQAPTIPIIKPGRENFVCPECGSAEVECLDWVRVNDSYFIGGNECLPEHEYWCPLCNIHEKPILASEYCEDKGHTGAPCAVCGASS